MHLDLRLAQWLAADVSFDAAGATNAAVHTREVTGLRELLFSAICWTVGWIALFYGLVHTYEVWGGRLRKSSKAHENNPYWCARSLLGTLHALLVSSLSLPAVWALLQAPVTVQFASSDHLGRCTVDPADTSLLDWDFVAQAVAMAGLAFTTFTLADVVVSLMHGLATADYMVHHTVFIAAGAIIRGNCILPLNAAVLMAMEVSTPFLNCMVLLRNRGDGYKRSVIANGFSFFITYLLFRIALNVYGTLLLWDKQIRGAAMPSKVPAWQAWMLIIAITLGVVVQLFWLPGVLNSVGSRMVSYIQAGDVVTEGDDGQEHSVHKEQERSAGGAETATESVSGI